VNAAIPRIRDGWRETLWAFLGAHALLAVVGAIGGGLLPLPVGQPPTDAGFPNPPLGPGWHMLVTSLQRQDAQWFLRLATAGYSPGDNSAAFFPLYPLGVRAVDAVPGIGPLGAGLLVANAAAFGALLLLHALTRLELNAAAARRAVLFTALFPTAFFLYAPYTESTFLLASVATFWFARRDRWGWAALAGAAAAATRSVGIVLILALWVEAIAQWRRDGRALVPRLAAAAAATRSVGIVLILALWVEAIAQWRRDGRALVPRLAAAAAVAIGPLLYAGWWAWRYQDLWAPLDAQRAWRPDGTRAPWATIWSALRLAWRFQTYWLLDVVVVALVIAGVVIAARRIPLTYTVYAASSVLLPLLLPLTSRPLLSMPRFVAVLFPASWGWAIAAERRRPPEAATLVAFAAGFSLLSFLFINWLAVF
jgi:Mannosyltransferase (PIG-V)